METRLANAPLTRVQRPDPEASCYKMPFDSLGALTPAMSWSRLFDGLGIADRGPVNVGQPAFMKELDAMMTSVSIPDGRTCLRRHLVNTAGDLLSAALVNENFEFDTQVLNRGGRGVRSPLDGMG